MVLIVMIAASRGANLAWSSESRSASILSRADMFCNTCFMIYLFVGFIFFKNPVALLGSIQVLISFVIPTLLWILPDQCLQFSSQELCSGGSILKLYSFLRHGLIQILYVFWFYPLYTFSLILSTIWYNDIAKYGFAAMGRSGHTVLEPSRQNETSQNKKPERNPDLGGVMIGIGEQVYSMLLLTFFFIEVYATGFIPYIGKAVNFLLLSWMYAYYCFEYKWNFSEVSLDKRLDFFESNWPFFAGFGSPCVLAIFFFSPLVSYGVMAVLFPLFVLTATGSGAEDVISTKRRKWRGTGLGRLPIFYVADTLSMKVLSFFPLESQPEVQDSKAL
ncbi:hypothetical protein JRO89_XS02G0224300 [Xanthoceras sorbifolium]|uniref:Protein EI24 homolog n=1 Tax=Xanthoceras sorbifolium TaxID=99658 RepID=A0ABQ8IGJ7_9ROSI|nr:hypothetical protein JRO89_XS02G0224300 [Xanthoceras sorbifolium]